MPALVSSGCTSVPRALVDDLTNSEEPFHCVMCSHSELRREIVQLKSRINLLQNEPQEIPKLPESVASLTREVTKLRNASKEASPPARTTAAARPTYSKAVIVGGPPKQGCYCKTTRTCKRRLIIKPAYSF